MFLVHASWVMNMSVDFPNIVKITMGCAFLSEELFIRIKHQMEIKFLKHKRKTHDVNLIIEINSTITETLTCSRSTSRRWHKVLMFPAAMTLSTWCKSVKNAVASATGKSSSFTEDNKTEHIVIFIGKKRRNVTRSTYHLYLETHGLLHLASQSNAAETKN